MAELKPCPFCGGDADYVAHDGEISGLNAKWLYSVWCQKSDCMCRTQMFYRMEDAAEAWNRRVDNG